MKAIRRFGWVLLCNLVGCCLGSHAAEWGDLSLRFTPDGALEAVLYTDDDTQQYPKVLVDAWARFVVTDPNLAIEEEGTLRGRRENAAPEAGLLRQGRVDLSPLREGLRALGLDEIDLSLVLPPASIHELENPGLKEFQSDSFRTEIRGYSAHGTWELSGIAPVLEIRYGYTPIAIYRGLVPLVLIGGACLVWVAVARVNAVRAPAADVPFFVFRCARHYDWVLYATWFAGYQYFRIAHPFDWLAYGGTWFDRHYVALPYLMLGLMLGLPLIAARVLLHPIFARYPDTTWTASDFLTQGIWSNAWVAVLGGSFYLFGLSYVDNSIDTPVLFIIGGGLGLLLLLSHFYQRSLGIHSQVLGDGELYDDVRGTAALLRQKPSVEMLYYHQCPLGNVFQVGSGLVQLSNVALATVTKSELRALLLDGLVQAEKEKQGLATGGAAAAGALSVWGSVAAITYELFKKVQHRGENKPSPLDELEAQVDQRALIRGLVKIDQLNQTLHGKVRAGKPLQRNRELEKKIEAAAARGDIGQWELNALIALEDLGDSEYYGLPGGEDVGDLLKMSSRRFAGLVFGLLAFVLPVLPGVVLAAWQVHTGNYLGHDYWLLAGAVVAGTVLLYLLQNHGDMEHGKPRRTLSRKLREEGAFDPDACFVGLAPRPEYNGTVRYDGSETWDEGFLSLTEQEITYQGGLASFSIPHERIRNIRLTCEFPGILLPFYRVRVDWMADGHVEPRTFTFTAETMLSRARANRNTRKLYKDLRAWYHRDAAFRPASGVPAFPIPHHLNPTANVMGHSPLANTLVVLVLMPLSGYALSIVAAIPNGGPLSASKLGVLIVSLGGAAVLASATAMHALYGVKTVARLREERTLESDE